MARSRKPTKHHRSPVNRSFDCVQKHKRMPEKVKTEELDVSKPLLGSLTCRDLGNEEKHQILISMADDVGLNLDIANHAWNTFSGLEYNYMLEGSLAEWLITSLFTSYIAFKNIPGQNVQALPKININKFLIHSGMNYRLFFRKLEKVSEMCRLHPSVAEKHRVLMHSATVCLRIFEKFCRLFPNLFNLSDLNVNDRKPISGRRKARLHECNSNDVFQMVWLLFISTRVDIFDLRQDIVASYHHLILVLELLSKHVFLSPTLARKLLNEKFYEYLSTFKASELSQFQLHNFIDGSHGSVVINEYEKMKDMWWRNITESLEADDGIRFSYQYGIFNEPQIFARNFLALHRRYERYLLIHCDFDERSHLEYVSWDSASSSITIKIPDIMIMEEPTSDSSFSSTTVTPVKNATPIKSVNSLKSISIDSQLQTPITKSVKAISNLYLYTQGFDLTAIQEIKDLLCDESEKVIESIQKTLSEYEEIFKSKFSGYLQHSENQDDSDDVTSCRWKLISQLFYKFLVNILFTERDFSKSSCEKLLNHVPFIQSLTVLAAETVMFLSGDRSRLYPWFVNCVNLSHCEFYKVIELTIRSDILPSSLLNHLSVIEETILMMYAWMENEQMIELCKNQGSIPPLNQVLPREQKLSLLSPRSSSHSNHSVTCSPLVVEIQPFNRMLSPSLKKSSSNLTISPYASKFSNGNLLNDLHSEAKTSKIAVKRNLFATNLNYSDSQSKKRQIQQLESSIDDPSSTETISNRETLNCKRIDSPKFTFVQLFFRKVYMTCASHIKSICGCIGLNDEFKSRVWTLFNKFFTLDNSEILRNRHLQQILLCCIYAAGKIVNIEKFLISPKRSDDLKWSFTVIVGYYRRLHHDSSVYRNVWVKEKPSYTDKEMALSSFGGYFVDINTFYNEYFLPLISQDLEQIAIDPINKLIPLPVISGGNASILQSPIKVHPSLSVYASPMKSSHDIPFNNNNNNNSENLSTKKFCYVFSHSPNSVIEEINNSIKQE